MTDVRSTPLAQRPGHPPEGEHGTVDVEGTGHSGWCVTADGGHVFTTAGGPSGMRATGAELLAASLAVCVAARVGEFLEKRGVSRREVEVSADFDSTCGSAPRVRAIRLTVRVHVPLSPQDQVAVRDALGWCTVLNTLRQSPELVLDVGFDGGADPLPDRELRSERS